MTIDLHQTFRQALDADPRTREPLNALIVWSELGKGLSGTLDSKGAEPGLLRRLIEDWSVRSGAPEVDLGAWAYQLPPTERLSQDALAQILRGVQGEVERSVLPIIESAGEDGGRAAFIAVVKGWFTTGIAILRTFPAGRRASELALRGALRGWCARFLPRDESGPAELGVRVVRE